MTTINPNWAAATAALDNAGRVLLVTHLNPDGDAIGSLLGLANALRARGITLDTVVDDGVPGYLAFLPGADLVRPTLTEGEWDVMVSLDSSDEAPPAVAGKIARAPRRMDDNRAPQPTTPMYGD